MQNTFDHDESIFCNETAHFHLNRVSNRNFVGKFYCWCGFVGVWHTHIANERSRNVGFDFPLATLALVRLHTLPSIWQKIDWKSINFDSNIGNIAVIAWAGEKPYTATPEVIFSRYETYVRYLAIFPERMMYASEIEVVVILFVLLRCEKCKNSRATMRSMR